MKQTYTYIYIFIRTYIYIYTSIPYVRIQCEFTKHANLTQHTAHFEQFLVQGGEDPHDTIFKVIFCKRVLQASSSFVETTATEGILV